MGGGIWSLKTRKKVVTSDPFSATTLTDWCKGRKAEPRETEMKGTKVEALEGRKDRKLCHLSLAQDAWLHQCLDSVPEVSQYFLRFQVLFCDLYLI